MTVDQKFLQEHFGYSETLQGLYWIKPTSKYAHPKLGNEYKAGVTDSIGYRIVTIFCNPLNSNSKNITFRKNNRLRPFEANVMISGKTISKSFATQKEAEDWVQENKLKLIETIE